MATRTEVRQPSTVASGRLRGDVRDPTFQAYVLLWIAFVLAPILAGVDKFFNWMVHWPKYLWVGFPHFFAHVSSQHFMYAVGVVEIVAGVLVFLAPRYAPYIVSAWLAGIVVNLVILSWAQGGHSRVFWDIALRDFGLMLGALALARLAAVYAPRPFQRR
jgi:uncharacterized membrane protein YphA (DoxX/SURF4 family)